MRREDGLSIIALILLIVVVAAVLGVVGTKAWQIFQGMRDEDTEYNKTEIVEDVNLIVKEKYVFDYKYCLENNQNMDELYNETYLIDYLKTEGYIEDLRDINDNPVQDQYYINAEKLNTDVSTNVINANGSAANGTKVFKIKKVDTKYMICYVDKYGAEEELGELVIKPEI